MHKNKMSTHIYKYKQLQPFIVYTLIILCFLELPPYSLISYLPRQKLFWFLQCLFFLAMLLIHPSIAGRINPPTPPAPAGHFRDQPVRSPPPPVFPLLHPSVVQRSLMTPDDEERGRFWDQKPKSPPSPRGRRVSHP